MILGSNDISKVALNVYGVVRPCQCRRNPFGLRVRSFLMILGSNDISKGGLHVHGAKTTLPRSYNQGNLTQVVQNDLEGQ